MPMCSGLKPSPAHSHMGHAILNKDILIKECLGLRNVPSPYSTTINCCLEAIDLQFHHGGFTGERITNFGRTFNEAPLCPLIMRFHGLPSSIEKKSHCPDKQQDYEWPATTGMDRGHMWWTLGWNKISLGPKWGMKQTKTKKWTKKMNIFFISPLLKR